MGGSPARRSQGGVDIPAGSRAEPGTREARDTQAVGSPEAVHTLVAARSQMAGNPGADIRVARTLVAGMPAARIPEVAGSRVRRRRVEVEMPEVEAEREDCPEAAAGAEVGPRRRRSSLRRLARVSGGKRGSDALHTRVVHHHLGDPLGVPMTYVSRLGGRQILGRSLLLASHRLSLRAFPARGRSKR